VGMTPPPPADDLTPEEIEKARLLRERRAVRARAKYERTKERDKPKRRAYYEANREEILAWHREHYRQNREEILAAKKEYRARNLDKERLADREYAKRHRAQARNDGLRRRYRDMGFTAADYQAMNIAQDGRCAICRRTPGEIGMKRPFLHVDHDHNTSRVRGLLCPYCNGGIGVLERPSEWLEAARAYLAR